MDEEAVNQPAVVVTNRYETFTPTVARGMAMDMATTHLLLLRCHEAATTLRHKQTTSKQVAILSLRHMNRCTNDPYTNPKIPGASSTPTNHESSYAHRSRTDGEYAHGTAVAAWSWLTGTTTHGRPAHDSSARAPRRSGSVHDSRSKPRPWFSDQP